MIIPKIGEKLNQEHLSYLNAFSKSCRHTIISMLKNSQSGHPGGSLSAIDYLSLIYSFIVSQSGEKVVVSNGHISPAVYSVLAELGYISKDELVRDFRKIGSIYEGHITRHVKGIEFGTGPLGIGVSVGSAFALSSQIKQIDNKVFTLMGDGEAQEGQVYEMMNFASANKLNNLILFIDYNRVQLTDSLEKMIPLDLKAIFEGCNWKVIEVNGHDFQAMWHVIGEAYKVSDQPVMILGKTIMGKGVEMMELDGEKLIPTWHGKTANPEESDLILKALELNSKELEILEEKNISWIPEETCFVESLKQLEIDTGRPIIYGTDKLTDCRTAYGMALLDLAEKNPEILAISADLRGSVMTKFVAENLPDQHIECGIAEQHMVSLAGGFSLDGFIPFCSTFGAFLSSRAKDQARVNDINSTNVKMVATHCGLSVGEDGPTHQAIDDMSSFLGMFNTMVIEPADPNQTDRIIRYIASHYGNFYVRMGRHKFPVITKEDGSIFYDQNYEYYYGKTDTVREGNKVTVVATGAMVNEALKAYAELGDIEIVAVSSIKSFDDNLLKSIKKTRKVVTVEDHNIVSGLSSQIAKYIQDHGIKLDIYKSLGVKEYQLSGKSEELYEKAKISHKAIIELVNGL